MELTGIFEVVAIKKKTVAKFFKELKPGDTFQLVYDLNGGYNGAPSIDIIQKGKFVHLNNALQLKNNLDNFELKQISL